MFKKKDYANLKRNLDKETKNATDDEYVHDEPLKCENIKSQTQENLMNTYYYQKGSQTN